MNIRTLENEVLRMPPAARANLAEHILSSLDLPQQHEFDKKWAEEVEIRIQAFEKVECEAIEEQNVYSEIEMRFKA